MDAFAICFVSSTRGSHIMSSKKCVLAVVDEQDQLVGNVKSVCAASRVIDAKRSIVVKMPWLRR